MIQQARNLRRKAFIAKGSTTERFVIFCQLVGYILAAGARQGRQRGWAPYSHLFTEQCALFICYCCLLPRKYSGCSKTTIYSPWQTDKPISCVHLNNFFRSLYYVLLQLVLLQVSRRRKKESFPAASLAQILL